MYSPLDDNRGRGLGSCGVFMFSPNSFVHSASETNYQRLSRITVFHATPIIHKELMHTCSLCQLPISGLYTYTPLGEAFCRSHTQAGMCRWCGRVATLHNRECSPCTTSGLWTSAAIRPYSSLVIDWLTSHIGPNQLDRVPINLVGPDKFSGGQYAETAWRAVNTNFSAEIRLLEGIPPINAQEALAHEFAHVLLVVNPVTWEFLGHHQLTPLEEEGFCEVIRALWIDHVGGGSRNNRRTLLETNTVDVYRLGFFEMWSRYQRVHNIAAFLQETLGRPVVPAPSQVVTPATPRIRISTITSTVTANSSRASIPVVTQGRGHRPMIPIKKK